MSLDKAQRGVLAGMSVGLGVTLLVFVLVSCVLTPDTGQVVVGERLGWLAYALVLPAVSLAIAIARLAKHRFFTPDDINGSALTAGSQRARLLQSLLQNTLEQLALALPVYVAWALLAPVCLLPTLSAAACLFLLGRLLFFRGYAHGAAARAFGFALTFYPTLMLLLGLMGVAVATAIA